MVAIDFKFFKMVRVQSVVSCFNGLEVAFVVRTRHKLKHYGCGFRKPAAKGLNCSIRFAFL